MSMVKKLKKQLKNLKIAILKNLLMKCQKSFKDLIPALGCEINDFIRTTED